MFKQQQQKSRPSPIDTRQQQTVGPNPIMRQGRFLSPHHGGGGGGGTPSQRRRPHQHYSPNQQHNYHQQQSNHRLYDNPLITGASTPGTSTVRFREDEDDDRKTGQRRQEEGEVCVCVEHSPSFLFEEEEWDVSDDDAEEEYDDGCDRSRGSRDRGNEGIGKVTLPSEAQLALLCLDYLRDLRRSYPLHPEDMANAEGLDADYISLAVWSLSRAFVKPKKLIHGDPKLSIVTESAPGCKTSCTRRFETRMYGGGGLAGMDDETSGNDAWYRQLDDEKDRENEDVAIETTREELFHEKKEVSAEKKGIFALSARINVPMMENITNEVLLRHPDDVMIPNHGKRGVENDEDAGEGEEGEPFYEHNDGHPSNSHRFYLLNGLASDISSFMADGIASPRGITPDSGDALVFHRGATSNNASIVSGAPLSLIEIVSAGLVGLKARSRVDADRDMVRNPLFTQFVGAASAGGFFADKRGDRGRLSRNSVAGEQQAVTEEEQRKSRLMYEEKYCKVVNKFRTKLAAKEAQSIQQYSAAQSAAQPTMLDKHQDLFGSSPISSPSRLGSAYRIMSGNMSTTSASSVGGGESVSNTGNTTVDFIASNAGVVDRQKRRRKRRVGRVKLDRRLTKIDKHGGEMQQFEMKAKEVLEMQKMGGDGGSQSGEEEAPPMMKDVEKDRTKSILRQRPVAPPREKRIFPATGKSPPPSPPATAFSAARQPPLKQPVTTPSRRPNWQAPSLSTSSCLSSPSPAAKLEAERLNAEGNMLMQSKYFQRALETYTSAIELVPDGPNSHVYFSNRSAAYLSLNDLMRSIEDSERSLELKSDYGKAHSRLGLAYFAGGEYKMAVDAYERALEIDPGNEWSRDHLERATERLASKSMEKENRPMDKGMRDEKKPAQEKKSAAEDGAELDDWCTPLDGGNHNEVEQREVTTDQQEREKTDKGNCEDPDAATKETSQADEHKDKGNSYMSNKEYEKALRQYDAAIAVSPNGPNSHVYYSNRAAAHCYLAEYGMASNDCRKSIELNPIYEKAHARLGLSLFFRGEYGDAAAAYRRSLELEPGNRASLSYLRKAEARLNERQTQVVEEQARREDNRAST